MRNGKVEREVARRVEEEESSMWDEERVGDGTRAGEW